jgi:uncharacterized RDD family membrane protein YckC
MEISELDLREQYRSLSTDELIELRGRNTLTELATGILNDELNSRGLSAQDKERLTAELRSEQELMEQGDSKGGLASLGARFVAQFIDSFIAALFLFLGAFITSPGNEMPVIIALILFIAYLWFADALPNGQSIGKGLMGIAAVHAATRESCTLGQSFIRNFLLTVLGIFDWIFIFGRKRQRLGDLAASTIVIKVK